MVSGDLLQLEPSFERAWQQAPPLLRNVGVPILAPTKPRPVVVLAVGADEEDTWHRNKAWVAPRYTHKEHRERRQGRNIVDLPAAPRYGLDDDGFLDLFQVVSVPVTYLTPQRHVCDLSPAAFAALLAMFRACLLA